jgi:ABC-type antimicrobial peptide transport system ATPase subunit
MRGRLASTLLTIGVAAVLVSSTAAALRWKVVMTRQASGDFASVVAVGNTSHPSAVAARIVATPDQRVTGAWAIVCTKHLGVGSKRGDLDGTTPLLKVMPLTISRPTRCTFTASAQLQSSGTISVQILKR